MENYQVQRFLRTMLCAFLYISTALVQASTHVSFKGGWLVAAEKGADDGVPPLQASSPPLEDRNRYLAAVARNGLALQSIPRQAIDREMCLTAVAQNGEAFEFVPDAFKVKSVCRAAILSNRAALKGVPKELQAWADQLVVLAKLRAPRTPRQANSSGQDVRTDYSEASIPSEALKGVILFASLIQLYYPRR